MGITIQWLFQTYFDALRGVRALSRDMWLAATRLRDCRTPACGVHVKRCPENHVAQIVHNSCGHRCCQQCSSLDRERWLHAWKQKLLPCPHHHVVFTIPHELLDLWRYNKQPLAGILFAAASQSLRQLLADPKYCGARVGLLAGLHTWSQTLAAHVHLHVLVTAGGLDEQDRWRPAIKNCLLPRQVLMIVFRGKFRALTIKALKQGKLQVPPSSSVSRWVGELNRLGRTPWNVKIFDRYRDGQGVATYLARYLRGGPIGGKRLLSVDDTSVRFAYRLPSGQACGDRSGQGIMTLPITEFLGRFLEHVPPRAMQTVRGYGLYAGNQHSRLSLAFTALGASAPDSEQLTLSLQQWLERMGHDSSCNHCPVCGRELIISERYYPTRQARSPPLVAGLLHPQPLPA